MVGSSRKSNACTMHGHLVSLSIIYLLFKNVACDFVGGLTFDSRVDYQVKVTLNDPRFSAMFDISTLSGLFLLKP